MSDRSSNFDHHEPSCRPQAHLIPTVFRLARGTQNSHFDNARILFFYPPCPASRRAQRFRLVRSPSSSFWAGRLQTWDALYHRKVRTVVSTVRSSQVSFASSVLVFFSTTGRGFQVEYPSITLHAISRAESGPCIYCQLDETPTGDRAENDEDESPMRELKIIPERVEARELSLTSVELPRELIRSLSQSNVCSS